MACRWSMMQQFINWGPRVAMMRNLSHIYFFIKHTKAAAAVSEQLLKIMIL